MATGRELRKSTDRIHRKDIYVQLSNEALRHRNYETETARWYTTILVAILGFILSVKFGTSQSGAALVISGNLLGQISFTAVVFLIAFSSCYSIQFYHHQHRLLEKYVDTLLEQEEVKIRTLILDMPGLKPRFLLMGTQAILALVSIALIFIQP